MRRLGFAIICVLLVATTFAQQAVIGGYDIAKLMQEADKHFNMQKEDAVFLLDEQAVCWMADGRLEQVVHQIIWVNSESASYTYGDHRISFDKENCTFEVKTVRTWRDNQWWVTGETGIVETLPYAVENAYDYTNMREMMLLHNGIEIPCIVEIAYSIKDKKPFRQGTQGAWSFMNPSPTVKSVFSYTIPKGEKPNVFASQGVPHYQEQAGESGKMYTWQMDLLKAYPGEDVRDTPHIMFSTWSSWTELGHDMQAAFEACSQLDDALKSALDKHVEDALSDGERADQVAGFVNKKTTYIDYDDSFWMDSPRQVKRTYETGYAHCLDRAVLAAALFTQAGITAKPMFMGKTFGEVAGVPAWVQFADVALRLNGNHLDACYNPATGAIADLAGLAYGKAVWQIDAGEPHILFGKDKSAVVLRLDVTFDEKQEKLTGKGYFCANGCLAPYEAIRSGAKAYFEQLISGVIGGTITRIDPVAFSSSEVVFHFGFEVTRPEEDKLKRVPFTIGILPAGISTAFLADVPAYLQEREIPIYLANTVSQQIDITMHTDGLEVVYVPQSMKIENSAGSFALECREEEGKLSMKKSFALGKPEYGPQDWRQLRELLLANSHEKNKRLLFRKGKE